MVRSCAAFCSLRSTTSPPSCVPVCRLNSRWRCAGLRDTFSARSRIEHEGSASFTRNHARPAVFQPVGAGLLCRIRRKTDVGRQLVRGEPAAAQTSARPILPPRPGEMANCVISQTCRCRLQASSVAGGLAIDSWEAGQEKSAGGVVREIVRKRAKHPVAPRGRDTPPTVSWGRLVLFAAMGRKKLGCNEAVGCILSRPRPENANPG